MAALLQLYSGKVELSKENSGGPIQFTATLGSSCIQGSCSRTEMLGNSATFLVLMAERLGLFNSLSKGVRVEVRRRGASDGESL